jgi:hypothetical protein
VVKENGKFAMPAGNVLVSAEFAKVKFNITIAESENGAVEVAEKSVAWGEEVALTINPADGYMLDSVVVKQGDTKVEVAGNKFTMPKGDVNIEAAFKAGVLVDKTFLNEDFASNQGDFTMNNVSMDESLSYVWKYNSDYKCMVASAYKKKAYAAESWLISPAINLSNATTATLTFDHAANYQNGDLEEEFQLMVAKNPSETLDATEWTNLTIPTMPTKGTWTFASSGEIDLSDYVGEENVRIAFRYVSTSSAADTWEVKNVKVAGKAISDGTDDGGDEDDSDVINLEVEYAGITYYEEFSEDGAYNFSVDFYNYDSDLDTLLAPYVSFDIYSESATAISGSYSLADGTIGEKYSAAYLTNEEVADDDAEGISMTEATLELTFVEKEEYDDGTIYVYDAVATFTGSDGKKYAIEGEVLATVAQAVDSDDDDIYDKYVDYELDGEEATALRDIEVMSDVYARDGRIYAEEGARIYTVTGIDVTTLNGQLEGVYVVKNGNKVAKVVVK